jgi:hypothetical protein
MRVCIGTQQVAWLYFTAVTNQSSAFLSVQLGESVGTQPDGTLVTNYVSQAGRVVIVGEEPLLEAGLNTNRAPVLVFFGHPGTNYVVETNEDIGNTNGWQPAWQWTMTNLVQTFEAPGGTNRMMFFRARRE